MLKPSLMVLAIRAAQSTRDRRTAEGWVHFCITAAEEAFASVMENPPRVIRKDTAAEYLNKILREKREPEEVEYYEGDKLREVATTAAANAFRNNMPHVTGRRNAQAYIACVAAGVQRHYIAGGEARSLLYTAQLALTAARPSRAR